VSRLLTTLALALLIGIPAWADEGAQLVGVLSSSGPSKPRNMYDLAWGALGGVCGNVLPIPNPQHPTVEVRSLAQGGLNVWLYSDGAPRRALKLRITKDTILQDLNGESVEPSALHAGQRLSSVAIEGCSLAPSATDANALTITACFHTTCDVWD
jgi:hypothetical protein